ncbi:MAG: hypothetical protein FWF44_08010 [Defluviitaleaceae bacterium]|nr:hypothetical protein [Defluviitaleaceae bacterium]
MKKAITMALAILFTAVFIAWAVIRIAASYAFNVNCEQYLQRAATANSIALASSNLDTALQYLEDRGLTSGQVSIILHQPSNDIGYWYSNLKSAQTELKNMDANATQLEVSNELMKIKETLISTTSNGEVLIRPDGMEIYPHNGILFWMSVIGGIPALALWIWLIPKSVRRRVEGRMARRRLP